MSTHATPSPTHWRHLDCGPIEIRGRGNSTWGLDKKHYRVRVGGSAALVGMLDSRHWVLLTNHADETLLRNDVTFEVGRQSAWPGRHARVMCKCA